LKCERGCLDDRLVIACEFQVMRKRLALRSLRKENGRQTVPLI
jgi:hypothetical protein